MMEGEVMCCCWVEVRLYVGRLLDIASYGVVA